MSDIITTFTKDLANFKSISNEQAVEGFLEGVEAYAKEAELSTEKTEALLDALTKRVLPNE